jgi:hypothetical protein
MKCSRLGLETADGIPLEELHPSLYHNVVITANEALQNREPPSSLDLILVYTKL